MADADARDELVKLTGQMSIPVIVVGDQVVRGFNKPALKSAVLRRIPPPYSSTGRRRLQCAITWGTERRIPTAFSSSGTPLSIR